MRKAWKQVMVWTAIGGMATMAGCAPVPKPGPAKPPVIVDPGPPARPTPPNSAAENMYIPPADPVTKERITPNSRLNDIETIWNFRSAFNVAALNCQSPEHLVIADHYNRFLVVQRGALTKTNKALDDQFKSRFGASSGLRVRDTSGTDLYNYLSLPPVMPDFCNLMVQRGATAVTISEAELLPFAKSTIKEIDDLFISFYEKYEDYRRRLAQWEALYGTRGQVILTGDTAATPPPRPTLGGQ